MGGVHYFVSLLINHSINNRTNSPSTKEENRDEKSGIELMDGKGRWIDNVFIERLWRSVKYEEVYLHAYESLTQARNGLGKYFDFYNTKRKHQTLKAKPDEVYYANLPALQKVA